MKIKHFGGIEFARNVDELLGILFKRYGNDANEFWMTDDNQDNPCLAILVNKNIANVTYFPDEDSLGFQSVGKKFNLNSDDYSIFYTNTPEEEIEISNDSIELFTTLRLMNCILIMLEILLYWFIILSALFQKRKKLQMD